MTVPVPKVWAISDIHVSHAHNKPILDDIVPESPDDWLIAAGDIAEKTDDIRATLAVLAERFAKVIWVPGNHELWTTAKDSVQMYGASRYSYLVNMCRSLGVVTPEDPYPVFETPDGPVTLVPMFLLYDYTFLPEGASDPQDGLRRARERNVVATDEFLLSPEPYATRDAWCRERVAATKRRLATLDPAQRVVLINHWPLIQEPTKMLFYKEFCLWCGTTATADWHTKWNVECVVYGHLHIPRTTWHDGVRFEEVSLGYPREWKRRGLPEKLLRQILPTPVYGPDDLNRFGGHFKLTPELEAEAAKWRARAERGL